MYIKSSRNPLILKIFSSWFVNIPEFMSSKISKKYLKLILQIYQVEVANRET